MRKLVLAAVAGMLMGAAAVALAASSTPKLTVREAALTTPRPGHPQGVRLSAVFGWHGLSEADQPTLTHIDVWFPHGSVYNGGRTKSCSARVLNAAGPSGCPKASIMGTGGGDAFADTVITHPQITVVNGGANVVYFYTVLNNPARVQEPIPGHITRVHGQFVYHLSATIPDNLRIVAGVPIKLTSLHLSAGKGKWLELTSAPAGVKIVTTFDNGFSDSDMVFLQNS
jgi:hypothetical protein